ncbi:MAG: hypothetical protein L0027_01450 [Candidatus Rokubacteria bacterium]|nr:hypothetical protein [Candidatus Rokubacteria bacterium]
MEMTLIDDGKPVVVPVRIEGESARLAPEDLERGLGWEVTPEGLCREGLCVPLGRVPGVVSPAGVDLAGLAATLDRPLALDLAERAAYLGVSAVDRGQALATLEAPDFALPDLAGRVHSLHEHRGKKVFLIAYASW